MPYVDVSKESNRRSPAWKKFYLNKETQKAECQVANCGKILDAKNGSTRGLLQHLKIFHSEEESSNVGTSNVDSPAKKLKTINGYMTQKSREEREEDQKKYRSDNLSCGLLNTFSKLKHNLLT